MKEKYCSTCGQDFKPGELSVRCRLCMRNYHAVCWEKTGGCTTWGCAGKPAIEDKDQKISYKRCPFCGEEIISFATKCRYCRSLLEPRESPAVEILPRANRHASGTFRKDPILTSLLNLIFPGAGYMYLGLFSKGLLWFFIAIAAWFFTRGLGLIAVYLWVMYDSPRQAILMNRGLPSGEKPSNDLNRYP
ncbi:MAG: RING finger protein [Bacillota bacterium]